MWPTLHVPVTPLADDTVFMFLATGIPPEKIDHLMFRKWLAKHTEINGCIQSLLGNFPKVNVVRVNDSMQDEDEIGKNSKTN